MHRVGYRIAAGIMAAAIGFAPIGPAAAGDSKTGNKTGRVRAKSPLSAEAPLLGRIVITPSPEQRAKRRLERRMVRLENRANDVQRAGNGHPEATAAL